MHAVRIRPAWAVVALILFLGAAAPAGAQTSVLNNYVLFATQEIRSRSLRISRGDVGVNAGSLLVRNGLVFAPGAELSAPAAVIPPDAVCRQLLTRGGSGGAPNCREIVNFSQPFPDAGAVGAACGYPDPFPACSADPSRDVIIALGEERTLDPGVYGRVIVHGANDSPGVLHLRPGSYTMCSLRTYRGGQIVLAGPTILNAAGEVRIATQSLVTPGDVD